jgi:dGTPase
MDESDNGREDDGFQANAQNFRIALSLSCRGGLITDGVRGLNLTNAVLDSALKYPWERDNRAPGSEGLYGRSHWCVYAATEKDALLTILQSRGCIDDKHNRLVPPEAGERGTIARPVEEQIMDWADEISYVCHDLEDFTKAGLIPLDDILSGATIQMDDRYPKSPLPNMAEIDRFSTYLAGASFSGSTLGSTGQAWLKDVFNILSGLFLSRSKQKEDCAQSRSQSMFSTTLLLNYFLQATSLEAVNDSCTLTGYNARLKIAPEVRDVAYTLNQMVHCYVIDRPSLATQQAGQRRIVQDLYEVFSQTDRDSLFSDYWREVKESLLASGLSEERTRRRLAADMVSSMTESEAVRVHHRITGIEYGQLLDTL